MRRPNNHFTDWDLTQMNRVQSGNMPSMDEILADPSMRDLYVEDICPSLLNVNRPFYLEQINLVLVDRNQTNNSHGSYL